ncbi:MAG: WYL domain-containing protein [Bacteroidales bacterium]|nr:WYL domain-containing protein [Bacteroidales bacterium]
MTGNGLMMWLLHSFAISNRLSADITLRKQVHFEHIPGGIEHLETLMEALQRHLEIEMQYRRYYRENDTKAYRCKPLALKLFEQRWYLLARNENDETRCFALDRIETLTLTEETFTMPEDFDLQRHFQDAFGIYVEPDMATEEVVVKADTDQSNFLKGLPLHHSQRIIEETDDYAIFSWRLKPSYDFIQELLKMNAHIEVLEPISLREKIKELLKEMLAKY